METGLEIECFTLKNLAETHQVNDPSAVRNVITQFLGANFERVIKKKEFLDISKDDIMALFKSSSTKYSSDAVKWEAMLKWVKHGVGSKRQIFPDLFSFLKLEDLSLEFLKETVRVEPLVKKAEKCIDMLMEEIFSRAPAKVIQQSKTNKDIYL
ncbi:kelch-like protein 12 [Styela clava]